MPDPVSAVATLLTKVFGFAVDENGYQELTRENKLKLIGRGINDAIAKNDWPACDALFGQYRELYQQTGP
jgi:cyanophycinase-like exopeptidase